MTEDTITQRIEQRFIEEIRHHLSGWAEKVDEDFCQKSFEDELSNLNGDSIYKDFCFDTASYVAIRKLGRMSISIGRRLGEIYDKIPRFVAAARFDLTSEQVKEKFKNLELDICLRNVFLSEEHKKHLNETCQKYIENGETKSKNGIGIEIRYNFNPNDSARLRKDVDMVTYLLEADLLPIYLIFSSISPRDEAIKRLTNAGWIFLVGDQAINFMHDLLSVDFQSILQEENVRNEIKTAIKDFMKKIYQSPILKAAIEENK